MNKDKKLILRKLLDLDEITGEENDKILLAEGE